MNVLMLSHSDSGGGAAIAARRLMDGLNETGVGAHMLARRSNGALHTTTTSRFLPNPLADRLCIALDKLPLIRYPGRDGTPFSVQWLPDRLVSHIDRMAPDLVNLHWIGHGYVRPATLSKLNRPLVWTLHDVWPFTGGCHVNLGCTRYEDQCGACPRLGSSNTEDLSRSLWRQKQSAYTGTELTLVAPSTWMADCAGRSPLFRDVRIEVIPNGLNIEVFAPADKHQSRARHRLPPDKKLVLFVVAASRRVSHKGFDVFEAATRHLESSRNTRNEIELVLAGPAATAGSIPARLRRNVVGRIDDDSAMAALYTAADVTVVPSRQENLSQVALESLACGTPVVAFDTTGLPDIIHHGKNGYLARPFDAEDLAHGVDWVLDEPERYDSLSTTGYREVRRDFDIRTVAARYRSLFDDLLNGYGSRLP
jgi:glycosyltransferase involved in cell wall biosynthesis